MLPILLVDDNEVFAKSLEIMLIHAGYKVTRANSGKEALQIFDPLLFDLVLTDLIMPDIDGIELITELRRTQPGIKIIAMSGGVGDYTDAYLRVAHLLGADFTLAKPFTKEQLLTVIRRMLEVGAKPK